MKIYAVDDNMVKKLIFTMEERMLEQLNWSNYQEIKPKESGYYFTYHYNHTYEKYLYKAIWYDAKNEIWISPEHKFTVKKFLEESQSQFYTDCLDKIPNGTLKE